MPNYRLVAPCIRWGSPNLQNAIYFPFPADSVFSGSEPRAGSEFIQIPSGTEAAWRVGTDYVWAGTQRWIAQSDTLFYPRCTGWDGTLGLRVALESLQNRQTFSWHPDGRNLVRLPRLNSAGVLTLGGFGGWATIIPGGLTGTSVTYDGAVDAIKMVATNPTGGALTMILYQLVPAIPGETMALSVEYKVTGLSGGATGAIQIDAMDITPSTLSTVANLLGLTSAVTVRVNTPGFSSVLPASTAYARATLYLNLPAASAGTIWFRQAMLRRDSTDSTFVDNPSVDGVYFVEPTQLSPANESDGSRQLVMRIRTPSAPFDGY